MKLVVNTNTNTCKIYHYSKQPAQLTLLREISHPENKLRNVDITADKEGHYKASNAGRGAYSPRTDAKEVEIDNFAREIAKELNQERNNKSYDELILIAAPHMMGLLFQHMDKHVKDLLRNKIEKDILQMPDHELLNFLHMHTEFPDQK